MRNCESNNIKHGYNFRLVEFDIRKDGDGLTGESIVIVALLYELHIWIMILKNKSA